MKKSYYLINVMIVVEVFLLCGAVLLIRTFSPGSVLPQIDLPVLTVLSVIPMILSGYVQERAISSSEKNVYSDSGIVPSKGSRLISLLLAGASFTLLPYAAGWSAGLPLWKLFAAGTVVFGITDVIYTSMLERMTSGNRAPFPLITNGILLWLASLCFQAVI